MQDVGWQNSRALQPFLLLALDDYFSDPSQECLSRLFDAVNSMDLSGAPLLTRHEKMVMRSSDRKDIFAEKFVNIPSQQVLRPGSSTISRKSVQKHKSTPSNESYSSFEDGLLMRNGERYNDDSRNRRKDIHGASQKTDDNTVSQNQQHSPSDSSFSLGESAVWVGDETGLEISPPKDRATDASSVVSAVGSSTIVGSTRNRRSTDASSSSSHAHGKEQIYRALTSRHVHNDSQMRHGLVKDTHFYHTTAAYKDHKLPIKMPLSTFPEEVGDVGCSLTSPLKITHHNEAFSIL